MTTYKTKQIPGLGDYVWIRTCQECSHKQRDKKPTASPTDTWLEKKCRKCKSSALNWGSENASFYDNEDWSI
jgi:hypothetical protein